MEGVKVAKKSYELCYPEPLLLKTGDRVTVLKSEEPSSEWFGWHFCRDASGKEGWISQDFVKVVGGTGLIIRDYNARELNANAGDAFKIIEESHGWYWCSNADGVLGWVPVNVF